MANTQPTTGNAADLLHRRFPKLEIAPDLAGIPNLMVNREQYVETVKILRDDPELRFNIFVHLTAVHYPRDPQPFEVTVRLSSLQLHAQVAVRVRTAGDAPGVPSLAAFWPAADWHEREVFDMFGIYFEGHPDLRRIFLEENADFHPLRKEFPVKGYEK